ncbi:MAG TPA: ATP-binding protein [Anaerolineaceae bacterium]|nr:ATP-binding protein [Anaerolineaceae bacterium]HPN50835.1 ATP-binding protein [Anaerolineaceae bacterium]
MTPDLPSPLPNPSCEDPQQNGIRSLKELIDLVSGRSPAAEAGEGDAGLAEHIHFPFLALVGQREMKLALLLSLINPSVGGVLLVGARGTGKTTAVRGLLDLLPDVERSKCFYGCLPEEIKSGGPEAVCPACAQKYARGESLTFVDRVRLVELPLNATLDDVVGTIDERSRVHERLRLKPGILARAHLNILYIDEINLLSENIISAILDAGAQGSYTVRRGPVVANYKARFILIGSMNPEEGELSSQIMDRFGLRVLVRGLEEKNERYNAYELAQKFRQHPYQVSAAFRHSTSLAASEIQHARSILDEVHISAEIANQSIALIQSLHIDSLRAEISLFEAARAHAAAENRLEVTADDISSVAPFALRWRYSPFMQSFLTNQAQADDELDKTIQKFFPEVAK